MQLTSILALASGLIASASALPSSLSERQTVPFIGYIRFYGGNGCQEPFVEDTVFQQQDKCLSNEYTGPYDSFEVRSNGYTRTIRLFVNPVCNGFAQGNYIDVAPGQTGCFAGRITSYSFL